VDAGWWRSWYTASLGGEFGGGAIVKAENYREDSRKLDVRAAIRKIAEPFAGRIVCWVNPGATLQQRKLLDRTRPWPP